MASKKKAKTKAKKTKKKAAVRKTAPKKAARKSATKKASAPKKAAPKKSAKAKPRSGGVTRTSAAAPAAEAAKPETPVAPPAGERIGVIEHYYSHLSVAVIKLESGALREGEVVHIKGHTSDFTQRVESLEVDHAPVSEAHAGQSVGMRVREHAREHDVVYKVAQ
ncbi:MAG: EF-Tu/IF-2/RF-3 family GTPase [Sulfurifustaceae bacterium]